MKSTTDRIVLDDLTEHNKLQFKKINQAVLPVNYTDTFYKDCVGSSIHFTKLAYFNDLVVGGVCFRLEDSSSDSIGKKIKLQTQEDILAVPRKRAYIMTLACLAPYRRSGVGTVMLNWVYEKAKEMGDVDGIFLHVQTNNDAALEFYKHHEFDLHGEIIEGYYNHVDPTDAHLLSMKIEATKEITASTSPANSKTNSPDSKQNGDKNASLEIENGSGETKKDQTPNASNKNKKKKQNKNKRKK